MATIQRTVSIGSLTSLNSGESLKSRKRKSNIASEGFRQNWFENTLSFIKDDGRVSLNYGHLTPAQAIFVRDTLSFETNPSFKLDKYAPLYEALKIFGLKYSFKLSLSTKNAIGLHKIPKFSRQTQEPKSTPSNKKSRLKIKENSVLDKLSQEYMVEIAETIMDFMEDSTRASLEFTKVKPLESMFMHAVMSSSRPMFAEHCEMLRYFKEMKSKVEFRVQITVGKVNRKTRERTVVFNKVPRIKSSGRRSRDSSLSRAVTLKTFLPSSNSATQCQQENTTQTEKNSMETDQNALTQNGNSMQTQQSSLQTQVSSTQAQQNSTESKKNVTKIVSNTALNAVDTPMEVDSARSVGDEISSSSGVSKGDQSATNVGCQAASTVDKPSGSVQSSQTNLSVSSTPSINNTIEKSIISNIERCVRRDGLDARKTKLLEAMSMPVQIDNAARMMQKMGWDGGPLGCRGTGITEPLIPALELVAGAGFGHVKEAKPQNPPKTDKPAKPSKAKKPLSLESDIRFRLGFLYAVIDLIQTDRRELELVYDVMIGKKCINFIRHAVTTFSNRRPISLNDPAEMSAVTHIVRLLRSLPHLTVTATVSECKRKISLHKAITTSTQTQVITEEHLQKLTETINEYKERPAKHKKYIGIRITILIEILHLIKTDKQSKELIFDSPLESHHMNYIVKCVERLNQRKKPYVCAKILEQDTVDEILIYIGDTFLVANFDKRRTGVLIEKLLVHQLDLYNATVLKRFNYINNNNYYQSVPYSNLMVRQEGRNVDYEIIDLANNITNSVTRNNNSISNNLNNKVNRNKVTNATLNKSSVPKANNTNTEVPKINKATEINTNDKPKIDDSTENGEYSNGTSMEMNSDDDVILIETIHETIVISDDESTNTNENSEKINNDKVSLSVEKQGLEIEITNVEGNVAVDEHKREGSADMDISKSQNSTENCQRSIDILDCQESTEFDTSKSLNSVDFKALHSEVCVSSEIATSEGIDTENIESIDVVKSDSIDVILNGKPNTEVAISETDVIKKTDNPTMEAKKEKYSYSDEFDKDLFDLAMVLKLDDDVFDYTIVKKEDPDRSDRSMSKRSRSDSEQSSPDNSKKTKVFTFNKLKKISLVPKDYPDVELNNESAIKIQTILSDAIDNCKQLPLLKCHGIQDGGLVYSCRDEQSLFFIQNCLSVASDYKIINDVVLKKRSHIMKLKFNSLLGDVKKLFNRLELYNAGLITDNWCVKNIQKFEDYMLISLEIDNFSYKYIRDNKYSLYAGIDEVAFTVVWD